MPRQWSSDSIFSASARALIEKAGSDRSTLIQPITAVMRLHGMSFEAAKEAQRVATERFLGKDASVVFDARHIPRIRAKVVRCESKYPYIHRKLIEQENNANVAETFGISREASRRILATLNLLSRIASIDKTSLIDQIERDAGTTRRRKR